MKQLKCLIADDEPLALDLVENFLGRMDINQITRCGNGLEALRCLKQEPFDLVFLDVDMPLMNGLDLLRGLEHPPAVVITTAYRDYAVESFELEALDYLVKPFSFARFTRTMDKFSRTGNTEPSGKPVNPSSHQNDPPISTPEEPFLLLKSGRELVKIRVSGIRFIESRRDYVKVHTTTGDWLCHQSMARMASLLTPGKFIRIHRSYTVALDKIEAVRGSSAIIAGESIPVSRECRGELRRLLSIH